jgi:hypothetical protein
MDIYNKLNDLINNHVFFTIKKIRLRRTVFISLVKELELNLSIPNKPGFKYTDFKLSTPNGIVINIEEIGNRGTNKVIGIDKKEIEILSFDDNFNIIK